MSKFRVGDKVVVKATLPFRKRNRFICEEGVVDFVNEEYETYGVTLLGDGEKISCSVEEMRILDE